MIELRRSVNSHLRTLAFGLAGALALAGCAAEGGSTGSGGSGAGVAAGASIEEYRAAFEGVDQITLFAQTPSAMGSGTSAPVEKWAAAVEEWSGGKITFDIAYANAIAGPTDRVAALNDGRLDVVGILPLYEPDEFPANTALLGTGFISDQSPALGAMQSNAWPNTVAFNNDDVMSEFDDHGVIPLIPSYDSGASLLFCKEARTSLADFKGVVTSIGGRVQSKQIAAIGSSPTSVAYTELFESLQRGVVGCATIPPGVAVISGGIPEAPFMTTSDGASFGVAPGTFAFSKSRWEQLPLVAQQLLWDKLDVFLASNLEDNIFANTSKLSQLIRENNGSVQQFADDTTNALQAENDSLLEGVRASGAVSDPKALVDDSISAADDWLERIRSLGVEDEYTFGNFDRDLRANPIDSAAYTALLMESIWSPQRPE